MSIHSDTLFWFRANKSLLFLLKCCMLGGDATDTSFIVFGLTRTGLDATINRTRGKHANHYPADSVPTTWCILLSCSVIQHKEKLQKTLEIWNENSRMPQLVLGLDLLCNQNSSLLKTIYIHQYLYNCHRINNYVDAACLIILLYSRYLNSFPFRITWFFGVKIRVALF